MSTYEHQPPVLLKENARTDSYLNADNLTAFLASFDTIPWFAMLGEPSTWDEGCARIRDWSEWPGPESPEGEAFATHNQAIYDWLGIGNTPELQQFFYKIIDVATEKASTYVAAFDPEQDAWHGPSQCVHEAAYCAGLIACSISLNVPIHEDLQELWAWYQIGHWPSSFAGEIKNNETRLLVY